MVKSQPTRGTLSRNASVWSMDVESALEAKTPRGGSVVTGAKTPRNGSVATTKSEVAGSAPDSGEEDNEKSSEQYGRIIGGKYIEQYEGDEKADNDYSADNELAPLMKLPDVDIPLTLTERVMEGDKEYIVLLFAHGDKENPFNWSPAYKMLITTILNLMATTAYSSGINSMAEDLNSTAFIGQFGLFAFNFACALAPLFLAPFCEMVGRKIVYVGGFFCFSCLFIGLALAQSMSTIIGLRVLLGLFGCIGTILVGGTLKDYQASWL